MRESCLLALLALSFAAPGHASEVSERAEAVRVAAGDARELKRIAADREIDPWEVADELLRRGEKRAATAFARAAKGPDVAKLAAYVRRWKAAPDDVEVRRSLEVMTEKMGAGDPAGALARAESVADGKLDVIRIRLRFIRAVALIRLGRDTDASRTLWSAGEAARKTGWLTRAGTCFQYSGLTAHRSGNPEAAMRAFRRCAEVAAAQKDVLAEGKALNNTAGMLTRLRRHAEALPVYDRAIDLLRKARAEDMLALALQDRGFARRVAGNRDGALEDFTSALEVFRRLGNPPVHGKSLLGIGSTHVLSGWGEPAVRPLLDSLEPLSRHTEKISLGLSYFNLGEAYRIWGRHLTALEWYEKSRDLNTRIGQTKTVIDTLMSASRSLGSLGDVARARTRSLEALALAEETRDERRVAEALGWVATAEQVAGNLIAARSCYERQRELEEGFGDRKAEAKVRLHLASLLILGGDLAGALRSFESLLGEARGGGNQDLEASCLNAIGVLYSRIGQPRRALARHESALAIEAERSATGGMIVSWTNIGVCRKDLGDEDGARKAYETALAIARERGLRADQAHLLDNIGNGHRRAGRHDRAREAFEEALTLSEGHDRVRAGVLEDYGELLQLEGKTEEAARMHLRARDLWIVVGDPYSEAETLASLARLARSTGDPARALTHARDAVALLGGLARGLGEMEATRTREDWRVIFEEGVAAATAANDLEALSFFLESGRAGALGEALPLGDTLRNALVPDNLAREESEARSAEAMARARLRRARNEGGDAERKAHDDLGRARNEVEAVVQRIRRAAKAGADLHRAVPDSLARIRGRLRPGDALVVYGLWAPQAVALVVRPDGAAMRRLGATMEIEKACEGLRLGSRFGARGVRVPAKASSGEQTEAASTRLARLVVGPLGLTEKVRRVLVSPHGALGYAPFCLLVGGREVVYLPSATTWGVLAGQEKERGRRVLALGDPEYGEDLAPEILEVTRSGERLTPLPATRGEAKAVGDVVLLGKKASEAGLVSALLGESRWRAVHLACHGLLDAEQPLFSSLALTPDGDDDGFLAVHEVFRHRISADLVVLSACETAKGKVFLSEGIAGLTRGFMFAGAPRVLCSLWKVDDEATRALMIRFYELWNPKSGKGLPAATALRKAQEHVRAQTRWSHPYYWAAWVLWGLPD